MKSVDIGKLIEGLLAIILISIAVGKYDALHSFARQEAARSLRGWSTHAFFPADYRKLMSRPSESPWSAGRGIRVSR
jgi:hypothetical protein